MRSLGTVVHYTKVQLRFQHSQVGAGPGGACLRAAPGPVPSPQTLAPLSPRTSATATWSSSPPTSTSRPMVPKDSLSR